MSTFKNHFQEQAPKGDKAAAGLDVFADMMLEWEKKYQENKARVDEYDAHFNAALKAIFKLQELTRDPKLQELFIDLDRFMYENDIDIGSSEAQDDYNIPDELITFYMNAGMLAEHLKEELRGLDMSEAARHKD